MHKSSFSILTISLSLLAGCSALNGEQQQETLNAIKTTELNMSNNIENLKLSISNQSDYIESLETEIFALRTEFDTVKAKLDKKPDDAQDDAESPTPDAEHMQPPRSELLVLGGIENVKVDKIRQTFNARIDTGATTSSLNAVDIEEFERDGNKWVKFHIAEPSIKKDDAKWIEAPIVRYANIRQSTSEVVEKRAVIELWVQIGQIHEKTQFTLADRSQMSHPILLGREFIRDIALVDVSKNYLLSTPSSTN